MQALFDKTCNATQESPRSTNEVMFTTNIAPAEDGQSKEIVFIDSTVEDYQSVVAAVAGAAEVIILDQTGDGIEQITQVLVSRTDVEAVHIVSQDGEGGVQLGSTQLNAANVEVYSSQLQQWAGALTTNADILLYEYDVAATGDGEAFVERLSQLIGANVTVCDDLAGSAALAGDWDFERLYGYSPF